MKTRDFRIEACLTLAQQLSFNNVGMNEMLGLISWLAEGSPVADFPGLCARARAALEEQAPDLCTLARTVTRDTIAAVTVEAHARFPAMVTLRRTGGDSGVMLVDATPSGAAN